MCPFLSYDPGLVCFHIPWCCLVAFILSPLTQEVITTVDPPDKAGEQNLSCPVGKAQLATLPLGDTHPGDADKESGQM